MRQRSILFRPVVVLLCLLPFTLSKGSHGEVLDSTWTESPASALVNGPERYAGLQGDRSRAAWSGNGGRPGNGSDIGMTFSGSAAGNPRAKNVSSTTSQIAISSSPASTAVTTAKSPDLAAVAINPAASREQDSGYSVLTAKIEGSALRLSWFAVGLVDYSILTSSRADGPFEELQVVTGAWNTELSFMAPLSDTAAYFQLRFKNP